MVLETVPDSLPQGLWRLPTPLTLGQSFYYAGQGLAAAYRTQRNFRIHCRIALGVFILSALLGLSTVEWAFILGCMGLVLWAELMNTALEAALDVVVGHQFHSAVKRAKDIAAGSVLVTALMSVAIGACIFTPKLWVFLSALFAS